MKGDKILNRTRKSEHKEPQVIVTANTIAIQTEYAFLSTIPYFPGQIMIKSEYIKGLFPMISMMSSAYLKIEKYDMLWKKSFCPEF